MQSEKDQQQHDEKNQQLSLVLNVEQIQSRVLALEQAIFSNAQLLAQLLKQPELVSTTTTVEKWHHLLQVESANIIIHNRKNMQLLGMTDAAASFMKQHSNSNFIDTIRKPGMLFPMIPPLLLLLHLNAMQSMNVKKLSFKVCFPFMNALMQAHMHYDDPDYYWFELVAIDPAWFDDAFTVDDCTSAATCQTLLPIATDAELAYQQYLQASNTRDCNMIATFAVKNCNKFVVETSGLLHQVFSAQ